MRSLISSKASQKVASTSLDEPPKNVPINDNIWTCTVSILIERNSDLKKYVKCFEDGLKSGNRPVVKLINIKDLEATGNKGVSSGKPQTKTKNSKGSALHNQQSQGETNKASIIADQVNKIILKLKSEDINQMNFYNTARENCEKPLSKQRVTGLDVEIVHDEPSCGPSLYIVMTGFYDPNIIIELLKLKVPLEVIISFDENQSINTSIYESDKKDSIKKPKMDPCENFWYEFDNILKNIPNIELTSNLIVFNSNIKQLMQGKENMKAKDLNTFVYDSVCTILYQIQNEKRNYIDFIGNIKEITLDEVVEETTSEMFVYNDFVKSLPIEVITVDHILNGVINQIESDEKKNTTKTNKIKDTSDNNGNHGVQELNESNAETQSSNSKSVNEVKLTSTRSSTETKTNIPLSVATPFIIEYNNQMDLDFNNYQEEYEKLRNYHYSILERLSCPLIWRLFPKLEKKSRLHAKSHLQKLQFFFKVKDKTALEACLHKRLINKMILSTIDSKNIGLICNDTFNAHCGCTLEPSFTTSSLHENDLDKSHQSQTLIRNEKDGRLLGPSRSSFNNGYLHISREILDFHAEEEDEDEEIKEKLRKLNSLIQKNDKDLGELKNFLSCPDIDNLFVEYYDTIIEYNIVEMYSKETCINLLNQYSLVYDYVDYVYCSPTDSILFVFHSNINNDGFAKYTSSGYLLTATGFRDYYNILIKKYPYKEWTKTRFGIIEEENQKLMDEYNVSVNEKDKEKCCFSKIRKYGLFPTEEDLSLAYKNHAPHPLPVTNDDGNFSFTGYNMGVLRHVQFSENISSYVSKCGIKIKCKLFYAYNNVYPTNQIIYKHSACSIYHTTPTVIKESEMRRQISCETDDGIRIIFTYTKTVNEKVTDSKRKNVDKSTSKHDKKHGNTSENVHSDDGVIGKSFEGDTVITLANGLELTTYKVNGKIWGIRQRHLEKRVTLLGTFEKYRIYLYNGTIMIFLADGTIQVYYSNTTVAEIIRISSEKEFSTICGHDLTQNKRFDLSKVQKTEVFTDGNKIEGSYYVIGEHNVFTWSGMVKYFKFNFCTKSDSNFHLRTAYEPGTELFTLRTDGTKSFLNSKGELIVEFPDGSRITSTPIETLNELDEFNSQDYLFCEEENLDEDWIIVKLNFLMEEPNNYLPVSFIQDNLFLSLPGNKKVIFGDYDFATVSLNESTLSVDYEKGLVTYGIYESEPLNFSTFSIYFEPDVQNYICKFLDEDATFLIDLNGQTTLKGSQFFQDKDALDFFKSHQMKLARYSSGLTVIPSMFDDTESYGETKLEGDVDSIYAVKPNDSQKKFKLVYIKRDLTGCELVKESDHKEIAEKQVQQLTGARTKTEYTNGNFNLIHWYLDNNRSVQTFVEVPYLNPRAFTSTKLQRNNLTAFLNRKRIWLFDTTNQNTINKVFAPIRTSMRRSTLPSYFNTDQISSSKITVVVRKYFDLNNFVNFERKLQDALDQYLNYKKDIYLAILKNTIDEISLRQNDNDRTEKSESTSFK